MKIILTKPVFYRIRMLLEKHDINFTHHASIVYTINHKKNVSNKIMILRWWYQKFAIKNK